MPFDPYLALNAMLRAEAARFSPPAPPARPQEPESAKTAQTAAEAPAGDDTAA
ncbi:hypothetical protein [Streptomyces sp. NBC_01244]|uniref:hypothetical protein n=1 Tax=Streptomyces sp. NBC_01244 TaxID=2903797 RepID=UPI002E0D0FB3|nr:hypothetical protein OG247_23005 [Streptomyces sp. NBC_01244]